MNATLQASRGPLRATLRFFGWILLALLLSLSPARADGPDDDYLNISSMIDAADAMNANGQTAKAHIKYMQAQQLLMAFRQDNPSWDPGTVNFRLHQLGEKISETDATVPTTEPTPPPVTHPVAKPEVKSPVTVLTDGSEPRVALKFHPTIGDKHDMTMTMKIGMSMSMAGKDTPAMDIPAIGMSMNTVIKDISPDGDITYQLTVGDASLQNDVSANPAMASVMKASLAKFSNISGTVKVSDHGIMKSVDLRIAGASDPQTTQALAQMKESMNNASFVLPDQAVGPGARWQYKTRVHSQGITMDQIMTVELVSMDGDRVTLHTTLGQSAANQKVTNPAMPGLKVDLVKFVGSGTGTSVLDLGQISPISANLDENMDISMGINMGQKQQSMDMKMSMNLTFGTPK